MSTFQSALTKLQAQRDDLIRTGANMIVLRKEEEDLVIEVGVIKEGSNFVYIIAYNIYNMADISHTDDIIEAAKLFASAVRKYILIREQANHAILN